MLKKQIWQKRMVVFLKFGNLDINNIFFSWNYLLSTLRWIVKCILRALSNLISRFYISCACCPNRHLVTEYHLLQVEISWHLWNNMYYFNHCKNSFLLCYILFLFENHFILKNYFCFNLVKYIYFLNKMLWLIPF